MSVNSHMKWGLGLIRCRWNKKTKGEIRSQQFSLLRWRFTIIVKWGHHCKNVICQSSNLKPILLQLQKIWFFFKSVFHCQEKIDSWNILTCKVNNQIKKKRDVICGYFLQCCGKKNKAEGYTQSSLITLKEANRGNTKKQARLRSTHHAMERELAHKYSIYSSD